MATGNSKFVQKWLTVVQLRFFVNYLVQCGTTMVLQAMPFLHKFSKRYRQPYWDTANFKLTSNE
jgi:Iap family predicted aminopeptidase